VGELLDQQLPRPDWRKELARRKSVLLSCDRCGASFSAAVARCPACRPPSPPAGLARHRSVDILQQWWELPPAPVGGAALRWKEASGMLHLSGGTGGVTLFRLPEGVAALKPSTMHAVGEFLAGRLAEFLGVRVAGARLLRCGDTEFMHIKEALRVAPAPVEEHRPIALRSHGRSEFLSVLEFVRGPSLEGAEAQGALQRLTPECARALWRDVGRLCALDALINNVDRVPLLWDNEGNTANLMLAVPAPGLPAALVGIDQAVGAIVRQGAGRARYLQRVGALARWCFGGPRDGGAGAGPRRAPAARGGPDAWSVSAGLGAVRAAFQNSCGVDVDEQAFAEGLSAGLAAIADRWEDGSLREALDAGLAAASRAFSASTVDVGLRGAPCMREFVCEVAAGLSEARSSAAF